MTKVIVVYESGRLWSCEVDAVGDGDAGEICAAANSLELVGGDLVYEPSVMTWEKGRWRSPTGISDEWTSSTHGFIDRAGNQYDIRGGSMVSRREKQVESYAKTRYVLLNSNQLEGAVSITVDGILTYANEDGVLTSTLCGEQVSSLGSDFAATNSPRTNVSPMDSLGDDDYGFSDLAVL